VEDLLDGEPDDNPAMSPKGVCHVESDVIIVLVMYDNVPSALCFQMLWFLLTLTNARVKHRKHQWVAVTYLHYYHAP
jgi:hypothetical protein